MKGITILFDNDFCMVLNKPSGLPVQGGEGVKTSLDSILSENFSPRPLLVHRLDRDTSGLILVAKSKEAAGYFSSLIAGSKISKIYMALCRGVPAPESGTIELELEDKGKVGVLKKSKTSYKLLESVHLEMLPDEIPFSLLELELGTGRMHQIRRHLSLIGHPILGDDKYGDFPLNKRFKKALGIKSMMLHASRLIAPPSDMLPQGLDVRSPLPSNFSFFSSFFT